jgi:OFA family oxalate/formate antiporter-like MFS transporter
LPDFLSAFYCPSLAGLSIISGWIGFNFGANFSLFPSATAKYFGTKNLGANYGVMFTGYGIGGLIGPVINGKIFDLTGSYFYAFIFAGALCIVGILLSMCLKNEQI